MSLKKLYIYIYIYIYMYIYIFVVIVVLYIASNISKIIGIGKATKRHETMFSYRHTGLPKYCFF